MNWYDIAQVAVDSARARTLRTIEDRLDASDFKRWLYDLYGGDRTDADNATKDASLMLDYVFDYLNEEHQVFVRDDGLIAFSELSDEVARLVGELPVVLYHYTSSALDKTIRDVGLLPGVEDVNRWGKPNQGVYVTTETAGPAVQGYLRRAVRVHGGDEQAYEIVTRLSELVPDPDDADISSGRKQFVLPRVSPEQVLG